MKFNTRIAAAVAVVCSAGAFAPFASHAIDASTVPASNRLHVSGATATDAILVRRLLEVGGMCQGGTIDAYSDAANLEDASNRGIFCNSSGQAGAPAAGTPVGVLKESLGGSGFGTGPVADAALMTFVNPVTASCTAGVAVAANSIAALTPHQAFTLHANCPTTTFRTEAGVADVEPRLLGATPSQVSRMQSNALAAIVFAPAATVNLRNALQAQQGLTVGSDDETQIPSLSMAELRGLWTGFYGTWDNFTDGSGAALAPADPTVYICRRGDSSGTQTSFEAYFLNEGCTDGVATFALASDPACQADGCAWTPARLSETTFAGDGGGQVRACLDAHHAAGHFAIGVLSTDSTFNNTNRRFRYIGINQQTPTLEQVAQGDFDFFSENVLNRRTTAFNGQPVISGVKLALFNHVDNRLSVGVIVDHGVSGQGGSLGVPDFVSLIPNAPPVTRAAITANPVNSSLRSALGSVNNCAPPVAAVPVETSQP